MEQLTDEQSRWADEHRPVAIAVAKRYFRLNIMTMQETVSAAYMGLVKAAAGYDPSQSMPTTFIWKCCRCEILDRIREIKGYKSRNRIHPVSFTDYLGRRSDMDDPYSNLAIAMPVDDESDDRLFLIHAAIDRLAEPYITVMKLYLKDISMADIARQIGYTREGVRQIKKRAIDHLRLMVDGDA